MAHFFSHDTLVRKLFESSRYAREHVELALKTELTRDPVRLLRGRIIGHNYEVTEADLILEVCVVGLSFPVYTVIEAQSTVDDKLPFRFAESILKILRNSADVGEQELMILIPLAICNAERASSRKTSLRSRIPGYAQLPKRLRKYVLSVEYSQTDVCVMSDRRIRSLRASASYRLSLLCAKHWRDESLCEEVDSWMDLWKSALANREEHFVVGVLMWYLSQSKHYGPDRVKELQMELGMEMEEITNPMIIGWIDQGVEIGEARGVAKGKDEEARRILTRQLSKRFGPLDSSVARRISQATLDKLESWADNIVGAGNLTEVFA